MDFHSISLLSLFPYQVFFSVYQEEEFKFEGLVSFIFLARWGCCSLILITSYYTSWSPHKLPVFQKHTSPNRECKSSFTLVMKVIYTASITSHINIFFLVWPKFLSTHVEESVLYNVYFHRRCPLIEISQYLTFCFIIEEKRGCVGEVQP